MPPNTRLASRPSTRASTELVGAVVKSLSHAWGEARTRGDQRRRMSSIRRAIYQTSEGFLQHGIIPGSSTSWAWESALQEE